MRVRPIASGGLAVFALAHAAAPAFAQERAPDPFYCGERQLGRHFYCDPAERPAPPQEPEAPEGVSSQPSATDEIAVIQDHLEELRAEAVLRPTPASVRAYIVYQREQLDRASTFSDVWRRLLWTDPALDYTLQRPVSQLGKRDWLDGRRAERRTLLASLNERYGLFYFYAASCSACTEFSPVLKAFADAHGVAVKAVSVDGGPSPSFPDAVVDQGQMARLGLAGAQTPAVVLFDTETQAVTPIAFGIVSQAELEDRIFVLIQTQAGEDY